MLWYIDTFILISLINIYNFRDVGYYEFATFGYCFSCLITDKELSLLLDHNIDKVHMY